MNYPVLLGNDAVADAYGVESLPTTVLIDRAGREVRRFEEPIRSAELAPQIRKLLSTSPK
jgi:hypothetical protein